MGPVQAEKEQSSPEIYSPPRTVVPAQTQTQRPTVQNREPGIHPHIQGPFVRDREASTQDGERTVPPTNGAGGTDSAVRKDETGPLPHTTHTAIHNGGSKRWDLRPSNARLDTSPQVRLPDAREAIGRARGPPTVWERMFANDSSDKGHCLKR